MRFKGITKESGSFYKSKRERVDSRNEWTWRLIWIYEYPLGRDVEVTDFWTNVKFNN